MFATISLLIAVVISVIGQVFVKKGLNLLGNVDFSKGVIVVFSKMFFSPYVLLGFVIYSIAAFFWLYALTKVDLSFAYPFLALSYVLVILVSWLFLGENVSYVRLVGILVICLGVFIISKS